MLHLTAKAADFFFLLRLKGKRMFFGGAVDDVETLRLGSLSSKTNLAQA